MNGSWQPQLLFLTRELGPGRGGTVDGADGVTTETVVQELPVSDPKAQKDPINLFLGGGLQRKTHRVKRNRCSSSTFETFNSVLSCVNLCFVLVLLAFQSYANMACQCHLNNDCSCMFPLCNITFYHPKFCLLLSGTGEAYCNYCSWDSEIKKISAQTELIHRWVTWRNPPWLNKRQQARREETEQEQVPLYPYKLYKCSS